MATFYRLAADAVVLIHFSYVAFVVVGLLAILLGLLCRWGWVRNVWFRSLHLLAILIVAGEAVCGITCPLTTWEQHLRALAGDTAYRGDFIADWVHQLLFYEFPPWVFTLAYVLFGLVVLAAFVFAPPRWRRREDEFKSPEERGAFITEVAKKLRGQGQTEAADLLAGVQTVAFTTGSEWLGEVGLLVRRLQREFELDASVRHDLKRIMRAVNRVWPRL